MFRLKRIVTSSIYLKIFSALLAIVLCFYSISMFMNLVGEEKNREQVISFEAAKLAYFVDSFENEVSQIIQLQKECIYDNNIQMLTLAYERMNDYEKSSAIKALYEKLSVMKIASTYISSVKVHFPVLERTVTSDFELLALQQQEFEALQRYNAIQKPEIIKAGRHYYLNALPLSQPGEKPPYSLTAVLSADAIARDMERITKSAGGAMLAASDQDGWSMTVDLTSPLEEKEQADIIAAFRQQQKEPRVVKIGKEYMAVGEYSPYLKLVFVYFIPNSIVQDSLTVFKSYLWLISALSLLLLAVFSYWLFYLFKRPVDRMITAFKTVERGDFNVSIGHRRTDEFGYLYNRFNTMVEQIKHLVLDVLEQKLRVKEALLKQLQYQINPHFLYNSFFIISRMAAVEDCENIQKFSSFLGKYYRFINRNSAEDVSLLSELEHCSNYINIQTIRWGERIRVELNYEPDRLTALVIPSLIIQPLIENAYVHGLSQTAEGGLIRLSIAWEAPVLRIVIEDNGEKLLDEALSELRERLGRAHEDAGMSGIENVNRRIMLKYGGESGITVSRSPLLGLQAAIIIHMNGAE
ncbi:MAG: hypothetical protein K0R57_4081 [Paenibacillaceae bacterium]|nr:hypothetical protein [Paenibacillaceae bacterium]